MLLGGEEEIELGRGFTVRMGIEGKGGVKGGRWS